jgi:hypothetical protein
MLSQERAMKICVLSRVSRSGRSDPYVFHLGQRRHPVVAILSEWQEHGWRCLLVKVEDGRRFALRQDYATGEWELAAAYRDGPQPRPRPVPVRL